MFPRYSLPHPDTDDDEPLGYGFLDTLAPLSGWLGWHEDDHCQPHYDFSREGNSRRGFPQSQGGGNFPYLGSPYVGSESGSEGNSSYAGWEGSGSGSEGGSYVGWHEDATHQQSL